MRSPQLRTPQARRQRRRVETPTSSRRAISFPVIKRPGFEFSISQPAAQRDAPVVMPFRSASYGGIRTQGGGKPSNYARGKTSRQTEEHGDLNTYNRVYQFYNYHADKDILLDEMCRGLVLSTLRIAGGSIEDYTTPLAWPAPFMMARQDMPHHAVLAFHFKDNRRYSPSFGKTISTFNAGFGALSTTLPSQYDAEVWAAESDGFPPSTVLLYNPSTGLMLSLEQLSANIASMFKLWIDFTQSFNDANVTVPKGIDLVPCRMQLIKASLHNGEPGIVMAPATHTHAYEVVFDDREFGSSKVDVSVNTTIKLQNVTPASGNVLLTSDPMGSDNITHVPLKGKIYMFSGPVPKVWDKHRQDLQNLFKPAFFKQGRYLLPNSKLHASTTEEFRTPPRGRYIWSNCVEEQRITMAPGSMHDMKLNYRVKTTIRDFWYKYRDDDLSSSKLGKCICLCLEPSMRRTHVGTPIKKVLVKEQKVQNEADGSFGPAVRTVPVEYEPYEWIVGADGVTQKQIRHVFTFGATDYSQAGPGVVPVKWWFRHTDGPVSYSTSQVHAAPWVPLMWDEVTEADMVSYPELRGFVSRGDPLMFNVQINRYYGGSARLTNYTRLGSDKSGVKRKYDDKMVNNMGDVNNDGVIDAADWEAARAAGDVYRDHELESATQAGVRQLVMEGDISNTAVAQQAVTLTLGTDSAIGQAVGLAVANAMDTDSTKAGVQLDVSQLDAVLGNGGTTLNTSEGNSGAMVDALLAGALATASGTAATGLLGTKIANLTTTATAAVTAVEALTATGDEAVIATDAATAVLGTLAANTALNTGAVVASTGTAAALAGTIGTLEVEIAGKSFAPTNHYNTVNNDNTTTQNITVGATAADIANAIDAKELTLDNATAERVAAAIIDRSNDPVGIGYGPIKIQGAVTETAPLTSISVNNHPTEIAVNNHPTTVTLVGTTQRGTIFGSATWLGTSSDTNRWIVRTEDGLTLNDQMIHVPGVKFYDNSVASSQALAGRKVTRSSTITNVWEMDAFAATANVTVQGGATQLEIQQAVTDAINATTQDVNVTNSILHGTIVGSDSTNGYHIVRDDGTTVYGSFAPAGFGSYAHWSDLHLYRGTRVHFQGSHWQQIAIPVS